jgi:hypothetical protein
MIYYLASYPRSGNAWVRSLLIHQFGWLSIDIHVKARDFTEENIQRLNITYPGRKDLFGLPKSDPLYRRLFSYIPKGGEDGVHKALIPGIDDLFAVDEIRKRLALDADKFFIKTHFDAYQDYYPGEYVIQIVRNPGACIWSYYNFLRDVLKTPASLTEIITGKVQYGKWSDYQQKWIKTAASLDSRLLLVKYEDLFGKELEFCSVMSQFIHLPIITTDIKPFKFAHSKRPNHAREGKPSGWEQNYSRAQLDLLWQTHGQVMTYYGYAQPDFQSGLDSAVY